MAGIRLHQSAEYAHERRFTRSILADKGVDLSRQDFQRCAAIGSDSSEGFVDPFHPNGGRREAGSGKGGTSADFRLPRFPLPASPFPPTHRVLGTLMRPAIISCFSSSTRECTLSGMSA